MGELIILVAITLLVTGIGIALCLSDFIGGKLIDKTKNNNVVNHINNHSDDK